MFNSLYKKLTLFFILLFPILFIKQCEKNVTNFAKDLKFFECNESDVGIPGANFSTNCEDGLSKIPNFKLLNHNGDTITNHTLEGQNYILHFFFTSCPIVCPRNTTNIFNYIYVADRYGNKPFEEDEITILSISIDDDSLEDLNGYMDRFGIDPSSNWHFLTGDRTYVQQFANNMSQLVENNFKSENEEHMGYSHTEYVLLIDKEGFFRRSVDDNIIWDAQTENGMKILKDDIQALMFNQNIPRKNED